MKSYKLKAIMSTMNVFLLLTRNHQRSEILTFWFVTDFPLQFKCWRGSDFDINVRKSIS